MSQKDPERIEESEINKVVVCIMADHDTGRMKVGEIRAKLPHYARLSSKDGTTLRLGIASIYGNSKFAILNLITIVPAIYLAKVMLSGLEEEFGR
jgi:hypothetical protein